MRCLILILPMALLACNQKGSVTAQNASMDEVGAKLAASCATVHLKPGRWESSVTIDRLDMPGLPPAMAAQVRKQLADAAHGASCLTPEQANKPAADFFSGKHNQDCRYDRFSMGDGRIDATMTCGRSGQPIAATLKGSYGPDAFRMGIAMDGRGDAKVPNMAMTVDAKRVGACRGDEKPR